MLTSREEATPPPLVGGALGAFETPSSGSDGTRSVKRSRQHPPAPARVHPQLPTHDRWRTGRYPSPAEEFARVEGFAMGTIYTGDHHDARPRLKPSSRQSTATR
jgi:hypothetical protein